MSVTLSTKIITELAGLGENVTFLDTFDSEEPTSYSHQYRTQVVANTEEAIYLGDISTVELMIIKATSCDAEIDCDFDTTFDADLELAETNFCVFKPSGTVYIKNLTDDEQIVFEVWIFGT